MSLGNKEKQMLLLRMDGQDEERYVVDQANLNATEEPLVLKASGRFKTFFSGSVITYGRMSDCGEVVLKQSAFDNGVQHEWEGLNIIHKRHFPVPEPILMGRAVNGGLQIMLSKKIEGIPLDKVASLEPRTALGGIVRSMHDDVKPMRGYWEKFGYGDFIFYDKRISSWQESAIPEIAEDSKVRSLLRIFSDVMPEHLQGVQPGFVHRDVHDEQAILSPEGIVHLIDFEVWSEGDLLREVSMYLFHNRKNIEDIERFDAFAEGALGKETNSEKISEVLSFYSLFIAANALSYFSKHNQKYLPFAFQNLEKTIEFIDHEHLFKFK